MTATKPSIAHLYHEEQAPKVTASASSPGEVWQVPYG